ncbi:MAG TPA: GNAT family N-acetyltransferase, partial [Flavisolibacter sp.]
DNFRSLFGQLLKKGGAKTYGILSKSGELLASCVFFFSRRRAYYILVGNHPNGRTLGASHALIDAFICDHAEQDLLLDFEGSDIRNLAFFYSSFGATEEKYAAIKYNRLPWWANWLKE